MKYVLVFILCYIFFPISYGCSKGTTKEQSKQFLYIFTFELQIPVKKKKNRQHRNVYVVYCSFHCQNIKKYIISIWNMLLQYIICIIIIISVVVL